jgi:hypothetical protein
MRHRNADENLMLYDFAQNNYDENNISASIKIVDRQNYVR